MPKVLLVEDDNNLREIFQMRLQAEGYATATAADGEEGLAVAIKEKPDLIIADVMMPKLSGFEMIENLRAAPEMKDTKVVMMTALGQAEDQARGEKLGVVKYLVKSQVTLEDFARVVKEVLGPGNPQDAAAVQQVVNQSSNNQESENSMPEDTTPTNPSAPAEPPAPAEPSMPGVSPMGDTGQQSTADEQSTVQNQVNDFASAPAPADPAAAPADSAAPAPSDMSAPSMPPATDQPAAPSDPTAPAEPPAPAGGEEPSAPTDPTSNAL
ncbi:MAG: response regulator transcription factor [Candidatus Saccharimonadales bacterium]